MLWQADSVELSVAGAQEAVDQVVWFCVEVWAAEVELIVAAWFAVAEWSRRIRHCQLVAELLFRCCRPS